MGDTKTPKTLTPAAQRHLAKVERAIKEFNTAAISLNTYGWYVQPNVAMRYNPVLKRNVAVLTYQIACVDPSEP